MLLSSAAMFTWALEFLNFLFCLFLPLWVLLASQCYRCRCVLAEVSISRRPGALKSCNSGCNQSPSLSQRCSTQASCADELQLLDCCSFLSVVGAMLNYHTNQRKTGAAGLFLRGKWQKRAKAYKLAAIYSS